jgi:hypothetical protein
MLAAIGRICSMDERQLIVVVEQTISRKSEMLFVRGEQSLLRDPGVAHNC